jgi:uncharacterized protein with PIN domain
MLCVTFRFYAQLNDFLPPNRQQVRFGYCPEDSSSIKNMIESLGVPHTEVHFILVNEEPVDFTYFVQDSDRITVYPAFATLDISSPVEPQPLEEIKFVLDIHLGRLAAYLRMLGFDTQYQRNDCGDEELARISSVENRILLTRDLGLLKRSIVKHGYYVRETNPQRQLAEIVKKFNLDLTGTLFRRCLNCNGLLEPVDKELISDRLPYKTKQFYHEYRQCRECGKVYWKGSHFERMQSLIDELIRQKNGPILPDPDDKE